MTDPNHRTNRQAADDEIDLRELLAILWKGKWIIIAITFVFAVGSVVIALSLPNIYAAEAKLAPTEESQGHGGIGEMGGGQLGGLASLAGLQMGQGQVTDAMLALEILQSRQFIANFVNRHGIQADLLAVKEWDERSGEIIYDREVYNPDTGSWLNEKGTASERKPTSWELVEAFRNHLVVLPATETPLVTVKVEHRSPLVAKQWVDWLVEDINNEMRKRDIEEAERSIEFIDREMTNAQLRSTQQIYSGLMEQQTQTIMLANVRPEYIYRVIDPAVVPEQRAKPARALIALIGTLLGGFLSLLIVLVVHLVRKQD